MVVLQQGPSATEGRPSLLEYSQLFANEIRAAGGTPAFYMVWPALGRFFDFDGVSDSYTTTAGMVDGLLFPAGEAWRVAWKTDLDIALYGPDAFHPSALGSYLAAVVMYEQLLARDPRLLPATVATPLAEELTPEVAIFLHEVAAEANQRFGQIASTSRYEFSATMDQRTASVRRTSRSPLKSRLVRPLGCSALRRATWCGRSHSRP